MGNGRQAVIILGMHRGGTSAVAGAVSHLGLQPPKTPLPPTPDNPLGYFESRFIVSADQHILTAVGCDWDNCLRFDLPAAQRWLGPQREAQMVAALRHEFGDGASFVLKDPRLCVMLPIWRPALDAVGAEPHVLVVVRHPVEVYRSLSGRQPIAEDAAATLWLHHMLAAERFSRGLGRAVLLFDDLLADGRGTLQHVGRTAGIAWPRSPEVAGPDLDVYLAAAARRQYAESASAAVGPAEIRPLVGMTWLALQRLALTPEDATALDVLDHVRQAFAGWRQ